VLRVDGFEEKAVIPLDEWILYSKKQGVTEGAALAALNDAL